MQRFARSGRSQVCRCLESLVRLFQVILRHIQISQAGIGIAEFGIKRQGAFEAGFGSFEVALPESKRPQSHFQRRSITSLQYFLQTLAGCGDLIRRRGFGQQDWCLSIPGVFIKDEAGLILRLLKLSGPQINRAQLQARLKIVGGQLLRPFQYLCGFPKTALIEINDTETAPRLRVLLVVSQNAFILNGRLVILAGIKVTVRPPQMVGRLHLGGAAGARDGHEY